MEARFTLYHKVMLHLAIAPQMFSRNVTEMVKAEIGQYYVSPPPFDLNYLY